MAKVRISTTVDASLLDQARACCEGARDSSVLEAALEALIARHRGAAFDRRIDAAYRELSFDQPDQWGDMGTFLEAATRGRDAADPR